MPTLSSAPGQAFATIADAVSAAAAGDTILLETGEYAEALELNTSTSLVIRPAEGNRGKVVIVSRSAKPVLTCTGKDLVFEDLELQQSCSETPTDCVSVAKGGVCLRNVVVKSVLGSGLVVSGSKVIASVDSCTFTAGQYGCLVREGGSVEAKDTTAEDCKAAGIVSRGKGSTFRAETCIIQNNGGNGVGADEGGSAWLSDCQLLANKQCGAMASGLNAFISFSKCVASKNGTHGIAAAGRASITTVDSKVKGNKQLGMLIQSGAKADMTNDIVSKNGAHGICLQLGGYVTLRQCKALKNKQTGLAVMGVSSRAIAQDLTSSDNGIDGCHVGQGGDLDLRDSVMENNERMGMSALGADTKARLEGCVITGSKQHGIAQGQGAEVRVANNTVKDNTDKDVFGNVHEFGGDAHKLPPPAASSARAKSAGADSDARNENAPLMRTRADAKAHAPSAIRTRTKLVFGLLAAAAFIIAAVYAFVSYEHDGLKPARLKPAPLSSPYRSKSKRQS